MNTPTAALSVVFAEQATDQNTLTQQIRSGLTELMPGRALALVWDISSACPIEAWATQCVMGVPHERKEIRQEEPNFFGNVTVRLYRTENDLNPTRTLHIIIFLSAGPPARERAKQPNTPISESRLPTQKFAFTRDYANNVWHLRDDNAEQRIAERLACLLTWADETTHVLRDNTTTCWLRPATSADDLVGAPEKYAYDPPVRRDQPGQLFNLGQ